jgi:hypothetical protein
LDTGIFGSCVSRLTWHVEGKPEHRPQLHKACEHDQDSCLCKCIFFRSNVLYQAYI